MCWADWKDGIESSFCVKIRRHGKQTFQGGIKRGKLDITGA